jgi:hypothetical protein
MVKKWKTIMNLAVQDPKDKIIFSNEDLVWSEVNGNKLSIDQVAGIPLLIFPDFIIGEEKNPIDQCTFIRRQNKPPSSRASVALIYEL